MFASEVVFKSLNFVRSESMLANSSLVSNAFAALEGDSTRNCSRSRMNSSRADSRNPRGDSCSSGGCSPLRSGNKSRNTFVTDRATRDSRALSRTASAATVNLLSGLLIEATSPSCCLEASSLLRALL